MNIIEPILFQCRWQPLALALCAPGTIFNSVTYERLERFIHNVSRKAEQHGLTRGNIVALFIKDPILHSIVILGLSKLGVVTLSARETRLPNELHADAVLVDSSYPSGGHYRTIIVDKSWADEDSCLPSAQPCGSDGQPLGSGSVTPAGMLAGFDCDTI